MLSTGSDCSVAGGIFPGTGRAAMEAAWVGVIGGLAGVLLGSGLSEVLRRSNRIESYASRVFDKRMEMYEQLFTKFIDAQAMALEVMERGKHTKEERHAMISAVILDIADFSDRNALYLNEELAIHCTGALMGAEDVADIGDEKERDDAAGHVRANVRNAIQMIKAESGISRINRFFGKLTRAKISSPMIDYYRGLSKQRRR